MRCSHNLRRFSEFRREMNRSSFEAEGIAWVELSALLCSSCGPNTDGHLTEKEIQNQILYADFGRGSNGVGYVWLVQRTGFS